MKRTEQELRNYYKNLPTEDLVALFKWPGLSDHASSILGQILRERGISPETIAKSVTKKGKKGEAPKEYSPPSSSDLNDYTETHESPQTKIDDWTSSTNIKTPQLDIDDTERDAALVKVSKRYRRQRKEYKSEEISVFTKPEKILAILLSVLFHTILCCLGILIGIFIRFPIAFFVAIFLYILFRKK